MNTGSKIIRFPGSYLACTVAAPQPLPPLITIPLPVPQSEWRSFDAFSRRLAESSFPDRREWQDYPVLLSLVIGIPKRGDNNWNRPLNKPFAGPSRKAIIRRIRKLAKEEPSISVSVEITPRFWARIQERAEFYEITPLELCLSCIGYHAGLERKFRERNKRRSAF